MATSNIVDIENIQESHASAPVNTPLSPMKLVGVALLAWGLAICLFQLLIAGLFTVQQALWGYITLL